MRSESESQKSKRQQLLAFQMLKCRQLLPKLVCAFIIPKPLKTGFLVSMPTFATSESRANVWPVKCINLKTLCGLCECPFLKVVLSLLLFKLYAGVLFRFLVLVCFWCPLSFSNSSYKRERSGHKLKQESTCADPEGGQGVRTPPGKLQKYRVP